MSEQKTDALIIGGGLAGLTAAWVLKGQGIPNLFLERADRLGGRVRTENLDGFPAEMGGERIGLGDTHLLGYCHLFNLSLVKRRLTHAMLGTNGVMEKLPPRYHEKIAALVSTSSPPDVDNLSWLNLLRQAGFDPNSLTIATIMGRLIYGRDISNFSAVDILADVKAGVFKTADSLWIEGGNRRLVDSLALDLDPESIRLNSEVTSLRQNGDEVEAICSDGTSFSSKVAILALPPWVLLDTIKFIPQIPGSLRDALARIDYAHILKVACKFPRKFWPDDFEIIQEGFPHSIYNATLGQSNRGDGGVLMAYTVYDDIAELDILSEEEATRQVVKTLERCFSDIPPVSTYQVAKWKYAFSNGQMKTELSQPWGHILFAGEHLPQNFKDQGYMNGAIASGESAALEAVQRLK